MVSKKAKMLEKNLQEEMHPFSARFTASPAQSDNATEQVSKATVIPVDARNLGKAIGTAASRLQEEINQDTNEQGKIGIEENRKIGKLDNRIIGKEENRKIGIEEISFSGLFNLSEEAYRKDSFFFTDEEFNTIVDLKILLSRKEGTKITKTDLARIAFKMLIDDYYKEGDNSFIITYLKKRKPIKK